MLSRSYRLDTSKFNEVLSKGKIVHSPLFIGRFMTATKGGPRIAAVAPTKGFKTAVLRNRTRRRMYEATRQLTAKVKMPVQIILIAKPAIVKAESTQIYTDLTSLFVKAGIMR